MSDERRDRMDRLDTCTTVHVYERNDRTPVLLSMPDGRRDRMDRLDTYTAVHA